MYSEAAVLARIAGEDLLAQLEWMTLKPTVIVEVGCGVGEHSQLLKQRYPNAQLLAIDISLAMLQHGKNQNAKMDIGWTQANATHLPLADQSVDLIFANFFLAWQPDMKMLYKEWGRVLRPNGLLLFNLFGPATIKECYSIFKDIWVPGMIDMHDVGDMLLQQGFCDPVVETEYYTLVYKDPVHLTQELYESDVLLETNVDLASFQPNDDNKWPMTFEIVSAHAFAPIKTHQSTKEASTINIPLAMLRDSLR